MDAMTEPMRITILGAGGVGSYYGGVLAAAGHDVALLARGENLAALRERGLTVREPAGEERVMDVAASALVDDLVAAFPGDPELAIVAVKSYSLGEIAPAAAALADAGAVVVPLLNGVDIVDRLAAGGVPRSALLEGLTYVSAARAAPGVVERRSDFRRVVVGEPGGGASDRAKRVAAAFDGTGVDARASDTIEVELWSKFVFIAALSAVCGLARAPVGAAREVDGGADRVRRAVDEVETVAGARGVDLPPDTADSVVARIMGLAPGLQPSFLLDVLAGGPNELDVLSGAVSAMGRELGVATPVHDEVVAVLRPAGPGLSDTPRHP